MTIRIKVAPAFKPLFVKPARYRIAYGGRGSGKSWGFARVLIAKSYERKRRILCTRELQKSIKDSVHKLLSDQIDELGFQGFEITEKAIKHVNGSEFIFEGLRTNAPEIKSMEGIDIVWVEEAQKVSEESWDVLIPTIRKEGSEIWVTFNPGEKEDATSQRFIENAPPDSVIAKVNWDQNPWLSDELRAEKDYLKAVDPARYLHVWEGEYKDPNHGGKVSYNWSLANIETVEYDPHAKLYLTCDFNVDPMCWAIAHVPVINGKRHYHFFDEIVRENSNVVESCKEFVSRYREHKGPIVITGDAAGRARSDMSETENDTRYSLMKRTFSDLGLTNFSVRVNRANPLKVSRYERWNEFLSDQDDFRRVVVDPRCKQIIYINENAKYKPGCSDIWMPTPKQVEDNPKLKFLRDDMLTAVSYLVYQLDPKVNRNEKPDEAPPEIIFDV